MERLIEGYRRFRASGWAPMRDRYRELAREGQNPDTLVIACSDSRVDPATVFGAAPGEIFTIRNVAGLVPPYELDGHYHGTSAALEYGVRVLKVKNVVVLGHALCGGVRVMLDGAPTGATDFVVPWMSIAQPVLRKVPKADDPEDVLTQCEHEVVRLSLANLRTFPWVASEVEAGRLSLHGFRFDIRSGLLSRLEGDRFVPVV
jgi:carbonic anhydrase